MVALMSRSPEVRESSSPTHSGQTQAPLEVEVRGSPEPGLLRELLLLLLDGQPCLGERLDDRGGAPEALPCIARQLAVEESLPLVIGLVEVEVAERVVEVAEVGGVLLRHVLDDDLAVAGRDRHGSGRRVDLVAVAR